MEFIISPGFFDSLISNYFKQIPNIGSSNLTPLKYKNSFYIFTKTEKNKLTAYKVVPLSAYNSVDLPALKKDAHQRDLLLQKRLDEYSGLIVLVNNMQFVITNPVTFISVMDKENGIQLSI